jgi:hypothetical protein
MQIPAAPSLGRREPFDIVNVVKVRVNVDQRWKWLRLENPTFTRRSYYRCSYFPFDLYQNVLEDVDYITCLYYGNQHDKAADYDWFRRLRNPHDKRVVIGEPTCAVHLWAKTNRGKMRLGGKPTYVALDPGLDAEKAEFLTTFIQACSSLMDAQWKFELAALAAS